MQTYPEQWTHHHTHRLFHISMGLCFGFIVLTIVMGMVVIWLGASASGDPISETVNLSALVGGINPGPITGGGGGPTPVPPIGNPTITIVAEPKGQVPTQPLVVGPKTFSAYVFTTSYPAFSGQTSVANSLVFLKIQGQQAFNSTAMANSKGDWFWLSPITLSPGTYYITATVYDSQDLSKYGQTSTYFIIQPAQPSGGGTTPLPGGPKLPPIVIPPGQSVEQQFGVFFQILNEYKRVTAGNKVIGAITLVNKFSDKEIDNQEIKYQVKGRDGNVIMESSDTVSFSKISRFLKTIYTAPRTRSGLYTVIVTSTFQGITSTASDTFVLEPVIPSVTVSSTEPTILWGVLLGLLLLFLLLVAFAYYQARLVTRHINEHNERYHNEKDLS